MSAIAGIWSFDGKTDVSQTIPAMLRPLSMYGRDHCAQYSNGQLAMGRCLLRLLPEDRFDCQPLAGEGVTAMFADVRLDNRGELIRELKIRDADTVADSGILLQAWRQWRERCVEHCTGAFCFAVWNAQEQELFVARDHTGERPLFYSSSGNCFAFASVPKGLHPLPFIGAEVDEDYIARYLTLVATPVERTIFRRIVYLPAGCALSVRPGRIRLWRYWRWEDLSPLCLGSDEEYLELFRERFDEAVRVRLRTTGGIGSQLSGGLDSASVAATAARLLDREGRGLTAYTAVPRHGFKGIEDPDHFGDEGPAAAEVASLYPNMRHVLVDSSQTSFLDILDFNESLYDHPCYAPTNEVWGNAIMARAREAGITLLLNGSCGNATFSYYGMETLSDWLRSGRWSTLARMAWQIRRARSASIKSIVRHALWPSLPYRLRALTDPHMRRFSLDYSMIHPEISRRLDLERRALRDMSEFSTDGRAMLKSMLQYSDIGGSSIASQAGWQIDSRDPTCAKGVIEFCLTVPLEQFVRGGQLRSLARRSMVGRLPSSTLTRTQRGSQSADWRLSLGALCGQMLAEVGVLENSPLASHMLDLARMRRLIEDWPTTGFDRPEIQSSYHIALTRGFSVGRFLRRHDPDAREPA